MIRLVVGAGRWCYNSHVCSRILVFNRSRERLLYRSRGLSQCLLYTATLTGVGICMTPPVRVSHAVINPRQMVASLDVLSFLVLRWIFGAPPLLKGIATSISPDRTRLISILLSNSRLPGHLSPDLWHSMLIILILLIHATTRQQ